MAEVPKLLRDTATELQRELPSLTRYQDKQIILRIVIGVLIVIATELERDD